MKKLKANDYILTLSAKKAAIIASVILLALCAFFYFYFTPKWVPAKTTYGPSPQLVPNICTVGIALCSVLILITESRDRKKKQQQDATTAAPQTESSKEEQNFFEQLAENAESDGVTIDLRGVGYVLAALLACVFYTLVVNRIGFVVTMALITSGLMLLYGQRKPLTILITTAIMSFGLYYFFTGLLKMVLPSLIL